MSERKAIKRSIIIEAVFVLMALTPALILLSLAIYINCDVAAKMKDMVKTTATITRIETELYDRDPEDGDSYIYKFFVEYEYNGEMIEVQSDVGDLKYSEGDVIDFWYDPEDPARTTAGTKALNKSMLPVMLVAVGIFGIVPIFVIIDIVKKIKYLMRNRDFDLVSEPYLR